VDAQAGKRNGELSFLTCLQIFIKYLYQGVVGARAVHDVLIPDPYSPTDVRDIATRSSSTHNQPRRGTAPRNDNRILDLISRKEVGMFLERFIRRRVAR